MQDADRLESLGAIGLARVFYTSGALGGALFDSDDPLGRDRQLDDASWTLDHFQKKLLRLPDTMQTAEGNVWRNTTSRFWSPIWLSCAPSCRAIWFRWMNLYCATLRR